MKLLKMVYIALGLRLSRSFYCGLKVFSEALRINVCLDALVS
jgi:hypothetical protein